MPALVDGTWLAQYVEPQLLEEFRNFFKIIKVYKILLQFYVWMNCLKKIN